MESQKLIQLLVEQTNQICHQAENLKHQDLHLLTWREHQNSWSILECLEHLNRYGNFYLPEIERSINHSKASKESIFKSGLFGNYFANSMLPKKNFRKIKTFKDKNPLNAKLDKTVIEQFIAQQKQLLELLNQSKNVSLNQTKVKISISSLIKLQLGDCFRFYINHMIRHLSQIQNTHNTYKQMVLNPPQTP
ncbi:hypothetical protein LPBF_07425 [Flavobacterium crassostreae]|uniref:DinB-like domain-containing protein n=2 Tax=Flavobacterium crassostreae TaxID=1763534 RepID=A0A1B9E2G4_9FLAO|nr:DinB family protein [Flavobacterium crassostreae]OCB76132.1 hypothetical protein LPBF_07425 [Flavobacterium crassostreae]